MAPDFHRRVTLLVLGGSALSACATLGPSARREDARAAALRNVCGAPRAAGDSTCVVREAARVNGGHRFVIDRRPPAGQDRIAVVVRRGGWLGGERIEVTPLPAPDSTGRP